MTFSLVPIGDVRWVSSVMGLGPELRDIHLDQRMLVPYVGAYNWNASLVLMTFQDGYIVQPVLLTKQGEIRHAYNFGGPIASSDNVNAQEFVDNMNSWARKSGIISQYCTLIPSIAKTQLELLKTTDIIADYKKESVIIDLNNQKIRGTTRRLANKAKSSGVTVNTCPLDRLKDFISIYESTMDRVEAAEHWKFTPKWFELFARFLKPALLIAEYEGKPEAACLIVHSQQYPIAYYHFAGSYNNYPSLGINHLMVLSACEYIKSLGYQYLYLGGGRTSSNDDALLTFKSGFAKDRLPIYTYQVDYR